MVLQVIICGWRCDQYLQKCISSIDMQSYKNFKRTVLIDGEDDDRHYLVRSTVEAIDAAGKCGAKPDDIIVCVDADDFLIDEDAFKIIADAYRKNPELLLTYGSYINLSTQAPGKFCGAYAPDADFRTADWRGSHLKTFKYKLWQRLPQSELKDGNGQWFKCCADRAMMIPMMELAGHDRIKYIDTFLYCYNDVNPESVWRTNRTASVVTRKLISVRPRLSRLAKI